MMHHAKSGVSMDRRCLFCTFPDLKKWNKKEFEINNFSFKTKLMKLGFQGRKIKQPVPKATYDQRSNQITDDYRHHPAYFQIFPNWKDSNILTISIHEAKYEYEIKNPQPGPKAGYGFSGLK